jgi:hypothetical protein
VQYIYMRSFYCHMFRLSIDIFTETRRFLKQDIYDKICNINILLFHVTLQPKRQYPPHPRGGFSKLHNAPQATGILWTSDQSVSETSTWQHKALKTNIHFPVGFEPTIAAGERP